MSYQPDKWAQRAKKEGYLARSAYKLLSLDRRFKIFERGDLVLDLGAAPGSWIQVAQKKIGPEGFIVAVDLEPVKIRTQENLAFLGKDIYDPALEKSLREIIKKDFDVILSDASPNTTGQKDIDQLRSHELALRVIEIAKNLLKQNGILVLKIFESPQTQDVRKLIEECFSRVKLVKPEASTKTSKEFYIVALNKKTT